MNLEWWRDIVGIPLAMSLGTGIFTGFLVGRIFSYQQEIVRARQRIAEIPDRLERAVNAEDETEAKRPFLQFFHDIAEALRLSGQTKSANGLTEISIALQDHVSRFYCHTTAQQRAGETPTKVAADFERFALEAIDAATKDVASLRPNWGVLIFGPLALKFRWRKRPAR